MNKEEGRAEKNYLATGTISVSVADLRQIPQLGHTWKSGAHDFRIVRDIGPAVTHDHDSMVERVRIFLETLDPDPIALGFIRGLKWRVRFKPAIGSTIRFSNQPEVVNR